MKDILERLINGELNIGEAEKLIKAESVLEFDDIAKFEQAKNVKMLLEERRKLLRIQKRELNTNKKYVKMITKTRHN